MKIAQPGSPRWTLDGLHHDERWHRDGDLAEIDQDATVIVLGEPLRSFRSDIIRSTATRTSPHRPPSTD